MALILLTSVIHTFEAINCLLVVIYKGEQLPGVLLPTPLSERERRKGKSGCFGTCGITLCLHVLLSSSAREDALSSWISQ